jgi:hypothetical protein
VIRLDIVTYYAAECNIDPLDSAHEKINFIFRNSRAEKANQNGAPNLKSSKF